MTSLPAAIATALSNPTVLGFGVAAITGSLAFTARALPGRLWAVLRDLFSVTLERAEPKDPKKRELKPFVEVGNWVQP